MLKTISAALLATSLIAVPALAQSNVKVQESGGASATTGTNGNGKMAKPAAHKAKKHTAKHSKSMKKHAKNTAKTKVKQPSE